MPIHAFPFSIRGCGLTPASDLRDISNMEDDRRVNGNGKAEELRLEQGEAPQDASGDRGRDKVGDRERSPSPVPSPASSSGRGRGRSRTRASQNFSVLADDQHSNRR